jgi:hypothetical protein
MYALFILGTAATGWAFVLDLFGRTADSEEPLSRYLRNLYGAAMFGFAGSMIMNTVHLIAG